MHASIETTTTDSTRAHSKFYRNLLLDWSWVNRRVEAVQVIDLAHRERAVSIDVDLAAVAQLALHSGIDDDAPLPLPLGVIEKGLLLDFDVRNTSDNAVSVISSNKSAALAVDAILLEAEDLVAPENVDPDIRELVQELVTHSWSAAERALFRRDNRLPDPPMMESVCAKARRQWSELKQKDTFARLISDFTFYFCPVVLIETEDRLSSILKYRHVENERDSVSGLVNEDLPQKSLRKKFVARSHWPLIVRFDNVGRAQRVHIRVEAPSATRFGSVVFFPRPSGRAAVVKLTWRITPDRCVIYTINQPHGDYYLSARLFPDPGGFFTPVLIFMIVAATAIGLAGFAELLPGVSFLSSVQSATDAGIALLVIIPSLLIAYIVRDNEHPVRHALLRRPRRWLSWGLAPLYVCAVTLFVNFHGETWVMGAIWLASALCIFFSIAGLRELRNYINGVQRRVERNSDESIERGFRVTR